MKKETALVLGVIGLASVGMTLLAYGNPSGAFVVGGALMLAKLIVI